jgi:hypothetical protein
MFDHRLRCVVCLPLLFAFACGKPMDPSGKEDSSFTKASMGGPAAEGPDRPLAADLAVFAVEKLVTDNRIKTADKLQDALNKKPGQFSHLDLDKDNAPDPLTVAKKDSPDGHAFEIRARPASGEYVVATMVFDPEWTFLGHYSGAMGGAASTHGRPLPVVGPTTPAPAPTPAPVASMPTAGPVAVADVPAGGTPATGASAVAGSVAAVPTGSAKEPGLQATP